MTTQRYQWLKTMRDGGAVQRYHTTRSAVGQDVAAHSWGVALVLLALGVPLRVEALVACLLHDMHEQATGDVPAPAKWDNKTLCDALTAIERKFEDDYGLSNVFMALTPVERLLLRWADIYELTQWCREQVCQGNRYMIPLLANGLNATWRANDQLQGWVTSATVHRDGFEVHAADMASKLTRELHSDTDPVLLHDGRQVAI